MFALTDILDEPPYSLSRVEKTKLFVRVLSDLTKIHFENCPAYKRMLGVLGFELCQVRCVEDIPLIPVRLFKDYELMSVDKSQVVKTMTSSGTTGQRVSKIFLDRTTAGYQTKVLTKLVSSFIGTKRLPMLVIDSKTVIKDRNLFSARGAGILGFSMLGYDVTYALDENMHIDLPLVQAFLEKHRDEQILLFGFTFMIWEHFCRALQKAKVRLPLQRGIMMHGGGWKKLIDQSVSNDVFKTTLGEVAGITRVHNYYGMIEQTGSIFMECERGHLHTSNFSDVLIRNHKDFSILESGKKGLIQLVSLLPISYPGHSILSEDEGEIVGEDDCPCGRRGKYFKIHGRIKNAEVRGCSDTYVVGRN